ncbi:hypothetical protein GOODEAATRI_030062 [Goodea atripinnis]|uniref:Uncharacterized protein n=1 Tax=Goodea atripinnis TaxID=208336 RepID=A0ABV0Q278_9TELE
MNGEDAQLLSSSEVEDLIHKADEASIMSQSVTMATSLPTGEVLRELGLTSEPGPGPTWSPAPSHVPVAMLTSTPAPPVAAEITGLEAKVGGEPRVAEASAENPVTMVFMGYQDVEDEDETRKVLGLHGTVKAELVLIDDVDGKCCHQWCFEELCAACIHTTADYSGVPNDRDISEGAGRQHQWTLS